MCIYIYMYMSISLPLNLYRSDVNILNTIFHDIPRNFYA